MKLSRLRTGAFKTLSRVRRRHRRHGRQPMPWHAVGSLVLVLVLVNSCATRTRDPADPASGGSEAGATDPAAVVVGARDPPSESPVGNEMLFDTDGEHAWTPNAVVEHVVDGDTIDVTVRDRVETVRLIGIDAPESVAPTRPVQCFGKEASQHLEAILPAGTGIVLVRDVEARDAYNRLLGYVVRSKDGLFVNLELVAAGYAATLNYPPNDHYADVLARVEADAIAARRGLWGACGGPDVPLG